MDEVRDFARKFKPAKKAALPVPSVIRKTGRFIEKRAGLDQTHFALGLHMPCYSEKARYSSELFNAILGEGMSSRLFQEIREKRGMAYRIHSYLEQEKSYGHAIIFAGIEKKNIMKVRELALKEIKGMAGINSRDAEEAKEQKIGNWSLNLESCDETSRMLAMQEMSTKAEDLYDYPEKISAVKLEDIRKMAKIKSYSLAVLAPK